MISSVEEFLEDVEGNVLHAYEDSEGYLTIGTGRLIDARKGGGISDEERRYLLANDISARRRLLSQHFPWFLGLDRVREAVVISMEFQVGDLRLWPRFCNAMAVRDYTQAAKDILDSKVAREQAPKRWQRQAKMMETGQWV